MKQILKTTLAGLERKSWHLWTLAFLLLLFYAICIVVVVEPTKWETVIKAPAQQTLNIILISLMVLTLLFCIYVVNNERRLRKLIKLTVVLEAQELFMRDATFRITILEKMYQLMTKNVLVYLPEQLTKLIDELAGIIKETFQANYVSVMLRDRKDERLRTKGLEGIKSESIRTAVVNEGEGIAGYVAERGLSVLLNGQTDYSQFNGYFKKELDIQSAMSVPIVIDTRTVGIINVTRLIPADNFTDLDLRFLNLLAKDVSFTIKHIQQSRELHEREEQVAEERNLIQFGRLAASLAHDFKNVVFVIQGYVELLKSDSPSPADIEKLNRITTELQKLQKIVQNLRILGKQVTVDRKKIDLNKFINKLVESVKGYTGIVVNLRLAPNPPPIPLDPDQLQVALMNLIKNAAESMEHTPRKELTISTEIVSEESPSQPAASGEKREAGPQSFREGQSRPCACPTGRNEILQIKITDTGCGIPPEMLPKIFGPFFTTKELAMGSGLGLSIAHSIIRTHGGKIEVSSEPGQGTTFTITIPFMRGCLCGS